MNKYKLIKEYPGSRKLGCIIESDGGSGYDIPDNDSKNCTNFTEASFYPIDQPEFWEKVIEKDYEILSYYAKGISGKEVDYVNPNYIWKPQSSNSWVRFVNSKFVTAPYTTEEISNHSGYGIHSVIRLSDGEIFTVGDITKSEGKVINEFEIKDNELKVWIVNPAYSCPSKGGHHPMDGGNMGWNHLKNIHLYKKPLFTTEDDIDIFESDTFYFVKFKRGTSIGDIYTVQTTFNRGLQGFRYEPEIEKYFSTEEEARGYIFMNKPCLSMQDLIDVKIISTNKSKFKTLIEKLVKFKLKP